MSKVMGGIPARDGFWFQDARILVRLLRNAVARRVATLAGADVPELVRISVEAAAKTVDSERPLPPPRWDSVTYEHNRVIVDETKKGEVSKSERLEFYRRIRATYASREETVNLVPRLTTATGSQPNPPKWRDLAAASQTVTPPSSEPKHVANGEALAEEAMYYLTSASVSHEGGTRIPSPPMTVEAARAVLRRFEFDDELDRDATEHELTRLLTVLGAKLSSEQVILHLRGWISSKACAHPGGAELTCDTIEVELKLLARYLKLPVEAERLWHRLRKLKPPEFNPRIPVRKLSESQPGASTILDEGTNQFVALIGSGGIGKSFALSQRFAEVEGWKVWMDATGGSGDLEEALALGAWAAGQQGERLTVFVDGLDQATDAISVVAAIDRMVGTSTARAVIAARPTTWATLSKHAPRSFKLQLDRWSLESVAAATNHIPGLPSDLVDLLRTPLLLDLYLRIVGDEPNAASFHPTTRHELIAEYFARNILPVNNVSSPQRRELLKRLGTEISNGNPRWMDIQTKELKPAQELVGEGLLLESFGRFRFRHVLLQDVCVALSLSSHDAGECAARVQKIPSPTLQHDAMRALMEAAIARSTACELMDVPPVHEVVTELLRSNLPAADSAGDVVVGVADANVLLGAGLRLRTVLRCARAAVNRSWLFAIAGTSITPRPEWLTRERLDDDLFEIAFDIEAPGISAEVSQALAVRLRSWAQLDLQPNGWSVPTIVAAILRLAPTKESLEWVRSLPTLPPADYCRLLEHVRQIASKDPSLDDNMVADLVLRAFDSICQARGPLPQHSYRHPATDGVVEDCLQQNAAIAGLFATKPRAAYRVLFELVARHGEARRRERDDPAYQKLLAETASAFAAAPTQSSGDLVTTRAPEPTPPPDDRRVVEDVPLAGWSPDLYPLHAAWQRGVAGLKEPTIKLIAEEEARRSRSRAARNLMEGRDVKIHTAKAWVERGVPRRDKPLPAGIPEPIGQAYRALELLEHETSEQIRSSFDARGTLAVILASPESLDLIPADTLRRLDSVLSRYQEAFSQHDLEVWSDSFLAWIERSGVTGQRAIDAFNTLDYLLVLVQPKNDALLGRFAKVFIDHFDQASDETRGKLLQAACRLAPAHSDTCERMVTFVRSNPSAIAVSEAVCAFLNAPYATFLTIASELFEQSPVAPSYHVRTEMARRLGELSCYPKVVPGAWQTLKKWLHIKPSSGTFNDPRLWREFLDTVGGGASRHATANIDHYVEVATDLWSAWRAAETDYHGLAQAFFSCLRSEQNQSSGALASSLVSLACEVITHGDGYDLRGLDGFPWDLLAPQKLNDIVDRLETRIRNGPPDPHHEAFSAFISDLVKALAGCPTLPRAHAERLYAVVQRANWIRNREARCNELRARARAVPTD